MAKDRVLIALGDDLKAWNAHLLENYGLPEEPRSRYENAEADVCTTDDGRYEPLEDVAARQINLGEEPPIGLLKVRADYSGLEHEPTTQWKRSQAFMLAITWIYPCQKRLSKQKRDEMLNLVDDVSPLSPLPVFDESWGAPQEFLERWRCHELDVRIVYKNRGTQTFELWREFIPPDEPEDLDEASEPSGHWDGLKWIPHR